MDLDKFAYVTRQNEVKITTNCNTEAEKELFADYGEEYGGGFGER